MPLQPEKVTAEQLEVELGDRQKPLIIDFYATWCGPCVLLAKELEQARSHPPPPIVAISHFDRADLVVMNVLAIHSLSEIDAN